MFAVLSWLESPSSKRKKGDTLEIRESPFLLGLGCGSSYARKATDTLGSPFKNLLNRYDNVVMLLFKTTTFSLDLPSIIIANGCAADNHTPVSPTNTLQFKIQLDHDVFLSAY